MGSLIIFDTEFTAWPGSWENNWSRPNEAREIIQLAALKVESVGQQLSVINSFNVLVQPRLNPELSSYIQDLTGIEQHVLDDHGVDFPSCAEQFFEFTENGKLPCISWGPDVQVLKENYQINELHWQFSADGFINLKTRLVQNGIGCPACVSGDLAKSVGKPLAGHKHNALYDVKSILVYLQTLVTQNRLHLSHLQLD